MDVVVHKAGIPAMSAQALDAVSRLTTELLKMEQAPFKTRHTLHAGMYARTVTLAPGLWTGTHVTRGTILIIIGEALVYIGQDEPLPVSGVTVLPASAGRKQAFLAKTEVTLVMVATFKAGTVAEAEASLTDELDLLSPLDDASKHHIDQTGE